MMLHVTHKPITYLLPTPAWAVLLDIVAHDAPPGSVIAVQTETMRQLSLDMLTRYGRTDVTVQLQPPPAQPDTSP